MKNAILCMRGVAKRFTLHHQHGAVLPVLEGVDLQAHAGECLVLDGPSGMGKSTLLKLVYANYRASAGQIDVRTGADSTLDVTQASARELLQLRRDTVSYVSQFLRLIPRVPAIDVVAEALRHDHATDADVAAAARAEAARWLQRVEIDPWRIDDTPRVFSGGMRQRLQIARNLVTSPRLLFMDEPTSGLDVSVQARLLDLLRRLTQELQLAVVIVTHDLAVARLLAQRMVVMQRGRIVESGLTDQLLDDPQHPYTQLLVSSVLPP